MQRGRNIDGTIERGWNLLSTSVDKTLCQQAGTKHWNWFYNTIYCDKDSIHHEYLRQQWWTQNKNGVYPTKQQWARIILTTTPISDRLLHMKAIRRWQLGERMRYQGDIIAELVDYGYLDNEVDLQDRTYCGTKNDWVETDFNHYDEPISTAFKTTLKSRVRYLFAEPLPLNNFFVNLHKYYQLYYTQSVSQNLICKRRIKENFRNGKWGKTQTNGAKSSMGTTASILILQKHTLILVR